MIFTLIALVTVAGLLWLAYSRLRTVQTGQSVIQTPDNQYQLFRDLEPSQQILENPWVGFIQEDVRSTGPIGNFTGTNSKSGNAPLYMVT